MKRLTFQVHINADLKKVVKIMLNEDTFKVWTSAFNPTSHFEGSWDEGSKMLFVGINDKGQKEGMVSRIKKHIPYQYVSIEHLGILQDGIEITEGEDIPWKGAEENYSYEEINGVSIIKVELDTVEESIDYFEKSYPEALQKLKQLCEINNNE